SGLVALRAAFQNENSQLSQGLLASVAAINVKSGRVIVTGMGKSGHIGRKIAATLASTGEPASFVHPGEASHGDLGMISEADVVIALSNSGETPELGDIIAYCGRFDIPLIAITGGVTSALGQAADILLPLPTVPEACAETRAPTTSTTMSLVIGDVLAVSLLQQKGFSKDDFRTYHPGGKLGASLKKVRHMIDDGRTLPLVPQGAAIGEAVTVLNKAGFGCVGVTNGRGELEGIITDGDLRRHFNDNFAQLKVDAVMTRAPKTVTPDTLAAEALGLLAKTKITALFVVDDQKPVGLLHVHDVLSAGVL
ncbi:MAG: KpsF/GutQ family sugar-phosphate isomerase, partial [Pseudomonadota bacterium]